MENEMKDVWTGVTERWLVVGRWQEMQKRGSGKKERADPASQQV